MFILSYLYFYVVTVNFPNYTKSEHLHHDMLVNLRKTDNVVLYPSVSKENITFLANPVKPGLDNRKELMSLKINVITESNVTKEADHINLYYMADAYATKSLYNDKRESSLQFENREHFIMKTNISTTYSWEDVAHICSQAFSGSTPFLYNTPFENFFMARYILGDHPGPYLLYTGWKKTSKVKIFIPNCCE